MANYSSELTKSVETDFIPRATAGITYEYMLTEKLSIGIDALYNQHGQISYITFTDEQGTVVGKGETRHEMDYFSLPIKVAYKTSGKLYGYASVGFLPSYLTKSIVRFSGDVLLPYEVLEIDVTKMKSNERLNLGGIAELGAGYRSNSGVSIYAAIGYQYGVTNIDVPNSSESYKVKHYGIMASLGVKYALGK